MCELLLNMDKEHKCEWNPVVLNQALISGGIAGLIGIEELKHYNIERQKETEDKFTKAKLQVSRKGKNKLLKPTSHLASKKRKLYTPQSTLPNWEVHTIKTKTSQTGIVSPKKNPGVNIRKSITGEEDDDMDGGGSNSNDLHRTNSACKEQILMKDEVDSLTIPKGMEVWSNLHAPMPVIQALVDLGFKEPTLIQSLVLPPAIKGRRDILGAAETGSGKTLAFGIPIIHGILQQKKKEIEVGVTEGSAYIGQEMLLQEDEGNDDLREFSDEHLRNKDTIEFEKIIPSVKSKKLYALILTPTRELAMQVHNHLQAAAKYTGIKVAVVVGGMAPQKQERVLKYGPEIVVATPGRLWEMIESGNPHLQNIPDIRFLAIDETDRMLEKGHFQELQILLERINTNEAKKNRRQNFVFSATLTLVHEPPKYANKGSHKAKRVTPGEKLQSMITSLGITNPKIVDITQKTATAGTLTEARIVCKLEEKDVYLYYFLLAHPGRTLVFCNSISCVRRLAQILGLLQCRPLPLHANMQQKQRLKNLERFTCTASGLLLATDVAARGLDIPNVQHVIHYQVPRTSECYVHRSGRTARAQKEGLTVLIMEPSEMPYYLRLCRTLGRDKDLPLFPVDNAALSVVKERVNLAKQLDQVELHVRRNTSQSNWFQKAAEQMDIILDEDEAPQKFDNEKSSAIKKQTNALRRKLQNLLAKPMLSRPTSWKFPTQTGKLPGPLERVDALEVIKKSKKRRR